MTLMRVLDVLLTIACLVMAIFSYHSWSCILWGASSLFCACSAYWCWADKMNAWLKRYLAKTTLGYVLRIRASRL